MLDKTRYIKSTNGTIAPEEASVPMVLKIREK